MHLREIPLLVSSFFEFSVYTGVGVGRVCPPHHVARDAFENPWLGAGACAKPCTTLASDAKLQELHRGLPRAFVWV